MRTLFTIPRFVPPSECQQMIDDAESRGFDAAPITTAGGFVMMPEVRNNTRVMVDDIPLATRLWARLAPMLEGRVSPGFVGLNERFRFYRYDPGQAFRWHRDGRFVRNAKEASRLTFMIYLNEDFRGGATEFDFPEEVVRPATGMALVFEHALNHQGAEVLEGTKYVLRSDVMYQR